MKRNSEYTMKFLIVISSLIALSSAQNSQYGPPSSSINSEFSQTSVSSTSADGPKVYKHISIHVPPKDEFGDTPMRRIIRPMEKPDKVVNIIFVKAPSPSSSRQTEVILPEQAQSRTVVYILVKKNQGEQDIKIRQPAPTRPPKPEVYFLKYAKNNGVQEEEQTGQNNQVQDQVAPQYGPPVASQRRADVHKHMRPVRQSLSSSSPSQINANLLGY